MIHKNMFTELLKSIKLQDETGTLHILNFFNQEISITDQAKDSAERLSLLSDSSANTNNNTFGKIISQVKSKVFEISNEF